MSSDANIARAPSLPTTGGGLFTSSGTPLPRDIIEKARERVKIAAFVFIATWLFVVTMNEVVARFAIGNELVAKLWAPRQTLLTLVGLASSVAMAWFASRMKDRPELVLDIGLVFQVFNALIVAFVSEWFPRQDPQAVSWVCVTIVVWPAIAPSSPRKTLIAALAAATTVPIAILYGQSIHPNPDLSWFIFMWLVLPGYLCAALAVVPANVIRGLGKQVKRARELGSYQLEDQIGKGGMGEVYRARHRLLARPAAVKLISPAALRGSSPDENRIVIERFRREAEAAATLRSPHTIELYDYGVAEDGTFYYVMELLDGIDFQELVHKHGALPSERVIHLISQACDSLGEAHLAGLVHRDVKPSNILACRMGLMVDYVKVLDFGLVKNDPRNTEKQMELTNAGAVSGTPSYMAPESISEVGSVGPPADVYALGCVAYWLLTGQTVFKAANQTMMMMQHVQASPVPPSLKSPHPVPRDLEELVMRCLAKDPADRPHDAAELAQLLSKCRVALPWTDARAHDWWRGNRAPEIPVENRTGAIIIQ
ncbi:MAG TPA: serine/threonine-protein kinase [Thermoanaerobaculia bacterium]|nr:serine/threonine-protein kinase [Thermoanaerobaculia bacterium]